MAAQPASLAPFGCLWAFALLYHQVAYREFLTSPFDIALTVAALVTLVLPGAPRALAALSAFHILAVLHDLPAVTNHWYFAGLVSSALLLALLVAWWRAGQDGPPAEDTSLHNLFAPAGRLSLVLVYGLSGFHKLNTDFFTPGVSCATVLTGRAARFLGVESILPDPGMLVVWLTVLVELGLPVLLLPRTRLAGIIVAIGFHVVMALAGYPRFSAAGIALLSLFLPASAFGRWFETEAPAPGRVPAVVVRAAIAMGLLGVALTSSTWDGRVFLAAQLTLSAVLLLAAVRTWVRGEPLPAVLGTSLASRWRRPALLVPLLLVVIAAQPYLGLPTDRALGMYSNLRTEGGASNHFLVPAAWQLFPYQRDLVTVETSSAAEIQQLADQGLTVPFQELRARLTEVLRRSPEDFSLTYRRGGSPREVSSVRGDPELDVPVSRLQMMVFRFRAVEIEGSRGCSL